MPSDKIGHCPRRVKRYQNACKLSNTKIKEIDSKMGIGMTYTLLVFQGHECLPIPNMSKVRPVRTGDVYLTFVQTNNSILISYFDPHFRSQDVPVPNFFAISSFPKIEIEGLEV